MRDVRPSFPELRQLHAITLYELIADTHLDPRAVILLDTRSIGTPRHVDQLLMSLSRLAGTQYSRQAINVGDITFKLHPDYELIPQDTIPSLLEADKLKLKNE